MTTPGNTNVPNRTGTEIVCDGDVVVAGDSPLSKLQ